jgi:chromosome segregation ATPase
MRVRSMVVAFAVFMSVFAAAPGSTAKKLSDEAKKQLTSVGKQLDALKVDDATLTATHTSLVAEDRRLKDVDELLKGSIARYERNNMERNQSVAEYQTAVTDHNGRCGGSYSDANYVAQCNAEKDRLDARQSQLNGEMETLRQTKQGLQERVQGLSQGTLEWTAKVKAYNSKVEDLNERSRAFLNRVNSVLEDLKAREKLSVHCEGMHDLESAHRCLQQVWDGASK